MAAGPDDDPYQGLIPVKMVRGDLISSEFLLEKYLTKTEETLKTVGRITGVDRDFIKQSVYQENVLSEHVYSTLLADNPTKEVLKQPPKKLEELVFGHALYYPAEDTTKIYGTEYHLKTFIDLEINKHFGLSIIEYLNLSLYDLELVNKTARDYIEALRQYREKQERSMSNLDKNVMKEING